MQKIPETKLKNFKPVIGGFDNKKVNNNLLEFYSAEEIKQMDEAGVADRMRFGINPYYQALITGKGLLDEDGTIVLPEMAPSIALKNLVIPIIAEAVDISGEKDPSNQMKYNKKGGELLHKYDEIVLAYSSIACSAHCRYCYRLDLFNKTTGKQKTTPQEIKDYVLDYNSNVADGRFPVREVLLSGGDAMVLSNQELYNYFVAIAEAGVNIIRIGTKEMAFRPMRFDENFKKTLKIFHKDHPDVHVNFVTHFTHPDEVLERDKNGDYIKQHNGYKVLDPIKKALHNMQTLDFVSLENQTPIINSVNANKDTLHLLHEELRRLGVKPKYIFQCREIEGHRHFAMKVEDSWKIHNDAMRGLSDTARSRFAMSTEYGKLEVVSVIEKTKGFKDGLIILKVHRSPFEAETQGDIIIARRNPNALWLSDYEDRIIYDGRKQENKVNLYNILNNIEIRPKEIISAIFQMPVRLFTNNGNGRSNPV
jgi:L-lysine 2,3-aminomutase